MNPEQFPFLPFPPFPFFFPIPNEQTDKNEAMKPLFQNFFFDPMTHEFLNRFLHQISQYLPPVNPITSNTDEVIIVEDSLRFETIQNYLYFLLLDP
jgi:hypothetical protein